MKILLAILLCCLYYCQDNNTVTSFLEVYNIVTKTRQIIREFPYVIEAPNWTPDGKWFVFNSNGSLYKLATTNQSDPIKIDTGFAHHLNNDHQITRDGKFIAISHQPPEDGKSRVYVVPFEGGVPRLLTPMAPSYLHGWSPDNKYLSYCAERNGNFDVYVIPFEGGEEVRYTTTPDLDDGPEYSPDGKYIYFNSVRSGLMQIWRMAADGSDRDNAEQVTNDTDFNAWFGHLSPDGKHMSYIVYRKGDVQPNEHLPNKNVELRVKEVTDPADKFTTIVRLWGGQGTMNVNSWAPDNQHLAFVSYRGFRTDV